MSNYLAEQSAGGILRSAFSIYRRHFRTFALVYAVPTVPFAILQQEATANEMPILILIGVALNLMAGALGFAAITVTVSDVCLGNHPSVSRSLNRAYSKLIGRLLLMGLLQSLILLAGLIMLVVPAFVFIMWFLFAQAIVVLENRHGWNALKRSKDLGANYHWRNAGILLLISAINMSLIFILATALALIMAAIDIDPENWFSRTLLLVVEFGFSYPLVFIAVTLTYYDLRVRKEGYDAQALAEELAH